MCQCIDGTYYIIVGVIPSSALLLHDFIAQMGFTSDSDEDGKLVRMHIYEPYPLTVEDFAKLAIPGIMYVQDGHPTDRAQDQAFV